MGVGPGLAGVGFGQQGDGEGGHALHLLPDQAAHLLRLLLRALHDQLVMDLEDQPSPQSLAVQPVADPDHGQLDDVGGGALDGGV